MSTTLNILGPLLNPAIPDHLILETFDIQFMPLLAETVRKMGTKRSVIVHGHGLDEISYIGPARVIDVTANRIKESMIEPKAFGLSECDLNGLRGKDAVYNAQFLLDSLSGEQSSRCRAIADTFILNAAVAMNTYGIHESMQEAVDHAYNNLHNGAALD